MAIPLRLGQRCGRMCGRSSLGQTAKRISSVRARSKLIRLLGNSVRKLMSGACALFKGVLGELDLQAESTQTITQIQQQEYNVKCVAKNITT